MTNDEINDRVMSGAPCCGQCGEWLKGSENFCPQCGCQQLDTSAIDGTGVNLAEEARYRDTTQSERKFLANAEETPQRECY